MVDLDLTYDQVWNLDFEFYAPDGERPTPFSLEAEELFSGKEISLWGDQLRNGLPFDLSEKSLFVTFAADAELGCFNALGWPMPARIIDLRIEFLQEINFTPRLTLSKKERRKWSSLLHALTYFGLDPIDAVEKDRMHERLKRGGPFTDAERKEITAYNRADVRAHRRLFLKMIKRGIIPQDARFQFCLLRGRSMRSITQMEWTGVPIDVERYHHLAEGWEPLKLHLIETLGKPYGVFDHKGSFRERLFILYLNARGWPWPLLESGRLDLKDRTFKMMAQIHPELEDLRQLKYCLEKLKLRSIAVGSDGYTRCWLAPFSSRTARFQPSNAEYIYGPAVWVRDFLIRAKPGWAIVYIDYEQQEFGIAGALSGDLNMQEDYRSGDIYIAFGKRAGFLPAWATAQTHAKERDRFKVCVLATQYGQGYRSLSEKLNQPDIVGRELLRHHHKVYSTFWNWLENRVNRAMLSNEQRTVFDWKHRFRERPKPNSVRNFFMQGNGAEMLRLACCLGTEGGIQICAPVHDAILMQAPIDRAEEHTTRMRAYMAEASRIVLNGFVLRTEQHVFRHPEHYSDPKGRGRAMLETVMKFLYENDRPQRLHPEPGRDSSDETVAAEIACSL